MTRSRTSRALLGGALVAAALALLPASMALAVEAPDDGLTQTLDPNQAQGTGQVVLDDGHIDFGPTLNTGEWIVQIHDDTGAPSYWRMPSDVVAHVNDAAKLTIPESDDYAFLGLEPGTEAWVIPQVRKPGVIWTGWNTQEPTVLDSLSMGTTLSILGVQGPGDVSVYLQSGNFGQPEPLWSTHEAFPQHTWIESNTHTHANWVFDEPGVYLVEVQFSGELIDGEPVSAHDTLRFAVGDGTDPAQAFAARFDESALPDDTGGAGGADGAGEPASAGPDQAGDPADATGLVIGIVAGVLGAALIVAVVVVLIARSGAKRRARELAWQRAQGRGAEPNAKEGTR
jgi:putative ABC transporter-associated repeat protein